MVIEKKISARPLYLQVRDHLAQEIAAGERKPGSSLPSEVDLARELGVSAGTLRRALEALENERLIKRRQGSGTFVRDHTTGDAALGLENFRTRDNEPIHATITFLGATTGPATAPEEERLDLASGNLVLRIKQLRSYQDVAFAYEEATLPVSRFAGLEVSTLTLPYQISALAQKFGALVGGGSETVGIDRASANVAKLLATAPGTPLLKLDRVIHTTNRIPLEWRACYCHLTSVKYIAELRM